MSLETAIPTARIATGPILSARGVKKTFRMGDSTVEVLKGVDIAVQAGEFLVIEGRSGSGKSTLLHILGALDETDSGSVIFEGTDLAKAGAARRCELRNTAFGFVFQFYHLLPELDVLENTMLAAMIEYSWLGFMKRRREVRARAIEILKEMGLSHRLRHKPRHLSGGERQRVAIARALMNKPRVLLTDEPTGNLDVETGQQIMAVLERLHQQANQTIIMVTHDRTLASRADRVLTLESGLLRSGLA